MDLCGQKIIGVPIDERITKGLVIRVLEDALRHFGDVRGCILHSNRGSQYCSNEYRKTVEEGGFLMSMSRKDDYWDNASMKSFQGKLKQEWLNEQHFRTRQDAKTAVFEYIRIFYNRQRIHEANGYKTSEKYYDEHSKGFKVT